MTSSVHTYLSGDRYAPEASRRPFRWVVNAVFPSALVAVAAVAVQLPTSLDTQGRITLLVFTAAIILWATTSLNGTYVALLAVASMVLTGATSQEKLFMALGSDVIWLMLGSFVLGSAVQRTGLAARLAAFVVGHASSVRGVFWVLTTVLIPLALVVPSTSGRAAISLPLFRSIVTAADNPKITRAVAVLIPTVILVSTSSTLIAAGSHLIAVDLLQRFTGDRISYATWLLYGLPLGIVASYLATWVVQYLFLDRDLRNVELHVPHQDQIALSRAEKITLGVVVLMVVLWLTEHWHGVEIATVATLGALLLTAPKGGVLSWGTAIKSVSWNLIVFVGAATVMGTTLVDTGVARWLFGQLFAASGILEVHDPLPMLLTLSFITLTSHVYITSHSARAVALVPPLLSLASTLALNPVTLLFIAVVGMNYCQTFPVSSKALLMFYESETTTYQPSDLLKLSSVLLPLHVLLILAFYYGYWRWIGLSL